MAKVKIPLELANGTKARDLETLRANFDPERVMAAFHDGSLLQWLKNHYYEEEASVIRVIDKGAMDCQRRVCEALGVDYCEDSDVDGVAAARRKAKLEYLRQKTEDKDILANVDQTAIDQEDLSDLLDRDVPVIYLVAGSKFNIPLRVKNKKYVGIIGKPTIQVNARSAEELQANGITFEDVKLPAHLISVNYRTKRETILCPYCHEENFIDAKECKNCGKLINEGDSATRHSAEGSSRPTRASNVTIEELRDILESSFHPERMEDHSADELAESRGCLELMGKYPNATSEQLRALSQGYNDMVLASFREEKEGIWCIAGLGGLCPITSPNLNAGTKKACIACICQGKYAEDELVRICVNNSFTEGWAFTTDSFCCCEGGEALVIPYEDLRAVRILTSKDDPERFYDGIDGKGGLQIIYDDHGQQRRKSLSGDTVAYSSKKIADYLIKVGNLIGGHNLDNKTILDNAAIDEQLDKLKGYASFITEGLGRNRS